MRFLLSCLLPCLLLAAAARPAGAQEAPRLLFPLSCTYGRDCWLTAYADADPAQGGFADYTCGNRTSDAYNGIDIALPDRVAMETGVPVLAAAGGTVARVRDGLDDAAPGAEIPEKAVNDCGNGVMLDHGHGWQTLYCHLKKGSVAVRPGAAVAPGAEIGLAGQSGAALYPHLHLSVFRNGRVIDPFTGGEAAGCGGKAAPLWHEGISLPYEPFVIYAAGFKGGAPAIDALKIDAAAPATLPRTAGALTLWAGFFNLAKGDEISLSIVAPDGFLFAERSATQEADRPRQFYFAGKKAGAEGLAPGVYTGVVTVRRRNAAGAPVTRSAEKTVRVE
jgi:hypothetical protein